MARLEGWPFAVFTWTVGCQSVPSVQEGRDIGGVRDNLGGETGGGELGATFQGGGKQDWMGQGWDECCCIVRQQSPSQPLPKGMGSLWACRQTLGTL